MTLTQDVANWALRMVDQVPSPRLERTQNLVADSLTIGLAAAGRSAVARRAVDSAASGAFGDCRVLGSKKTLPPVQAAFANACLAHALDFDDTHDRARVHTTTVLFPAALAVAETVDADGERVLRAVTVGAELMCRWALAALATPGSRASSWYLTQLMGGVGAAITAGLVQELDDEGLVSAMGHAVDQASGAKASARKGDARAVYPGHAAAQGVTAVFLTAGGVRGASTPLEGDRGLWLTHLGVPAPEQLFLPEADAAWESDEVVVKPWPGCRAAHPYIDAVRALPSTITKYPRETEEVVVAVDSVAADLCFPLEGRRRPRTLAEAGFSVPFMVASALLGGGSVSLEDMTEAALEDPAVLALADRVVPDHRLLDGPGYARAEITVTHRGKVQHASGSSSPTLAPCERADKFSACLAHGGWRHHEEELRTAVENFASGPARNLLDTVQGFEQSLDHHTHP